MNDKHVVFGTGQIGHALIGQPGRIRPRRAGCFITLHRPTELPEGVDWRGADVTDPEAAADAAKGASTIYQCLNALYTKWPEVFPRCGEEC
jgi:uncharacterized protein YbjT (DUF2867 family)